MRDILTERDAAWIEQDLRRLWCRECSQCPGNWLHPQDHAGATAIRIVVNAAVAPDSPLAQVMRLQMCQPALQCTAGNARAERTWKKFRKDRDDVDAQCHSVI